MSSADDDRDLSRRPTVLDDPAAAATFLEMTFASMPDGLAAFDREYRLVYWNDRYFELMGYPRTLAARGTPFEEFLAYNARVGEYGPGDPDEMVRARMRPELLQQRRDVEWPRSSGHVVRLRRAPVPGGGLWVGVSDITEVKRQELRNRHSELRLELLSESVDEGLLIHDGAAVIDANGAAVRMLLTSRERLVGSSLEALFAPEDWTAVKALLESGGERAAEVAGRRTDGSIFPLELTNRTLPPSHERLYEPQLLQSDGRLVKLSDTRSDSELEQVASHVLLPEGRLVMMSPEEREAEIARQSTRMLLLTDLTERREGERERRRVEEQLRQSQKLEALGTLAGGIAHDFNNILSSVLGYAHLLTENEPEGSRAAEYGARILTAGNRAKELVNRMLTVSRKSRAERRPIDVEDVISEAMLLIRASLPATIEIRTDAAASVPPVYADPTQIHQVLMNLCANAGHAMRDGGTLRIALSLLDTAAALTFRGSQLRPGRYARITVCDTGDGIAEGVLDRIFDPFFTTKDVGEGTGLGLSIVHGIVASHEGAIEVHSVPGSGTSVHVYLPCASRAQTIEVPRAQRRPHGSGQTVLIVDDEPDLLEMLAEMLEVLEYAPTSAPNGMEALALVRADPTRFDLVITDLTMHGMTGAVLASEIRAMAPDIPVILATGYSDAGLEPGASTPGIDRVLHKPISLDELAVCAAEVLAIG